MNVVMINDGAANESLEKEISQFIILDVLNIRLIIYIIRIYQSPGVLM